MTLLSPTACHCSKGTTDADLPASLLGEAAGPVHTAGSFAGVNPVASVELLAHGKLKILSL